MNNNNREKTPYLVVELLEKFSSKELKGLQKVVSCAYFNTDRYVIRLLEILIKKILNKTSINQIIQLRLYNQVFNDLPSAKNKLNQKQKAILRSKISTLTRLAERFLAIEAFEQSDIHQYDLKLEALIEKKQYRLFQKHIRKAEEISKNNKNDFEIKYIIEKQRSNYLLRSGEWLKKDNINDLMKILDLRYLDTKIWNTANALAFQARKPQDSYDFSILELIESEVFGKYFNGNYPLLSLQLASVQLSLQQSQDAHKNFIDFLSKNESFISKNELNGYYLIALNHCARMMKKGQIEYTKKYVDILKILDEKELLLNSISLPLLKNMVATAGKVGEFEWTAKMIEKYAPYINPKHQTDVENFNLGYLAFLQNDYKEAINYLLEVNNFQKSYDIDKRMFILKSYYELEKYYTEPTAQLFRSIEAFVMNNKQYTEVDKKTYKNTIRIFYNLYRYKHNVGKMVLDKIEEKIKHAEYIASKAWLLEKIEELR